jgi:hypothetical protein
MLNFKISAFEQYPFFSTTRGSWFFSSPSCPFFISWVCDCNRNFSTYTWVATKKLSRIIGLLRNLTNEKSFMKKLQGSLANHSTVLPADMVAGSYVIEKKHRCRSLIKSKRIIFFSIFCLLRRRFAALCMSFVWSHASQSHHMIDLFRMAMTSARTWVYFKRNLARLVARVEACRCWTR